MSLWHNLKGMRAAAREAEKAKPAFRIQKDGHGKYWGEDYAQGMGVYLKLSTTESWSFEETERRLLNLMENRAKTENTQIVAEYFYGPSNRA